MVKEQMVDAKICGSNIVTLTFISILLQVSFTHLFLIPKLGNLTKMNMILEYPSHPIVLGLGFGIRVRIKYESRVILKEDNESHPMSNI